MKRISKELFFAHYIYKEGKVKKDTTLEVLLKVQRVDPSLDLNPRIINEWNLLQYVNGFKTIGIENFGSHPIKVVARETNNQRLKEVIRWFLEVSSMLPYIASNFNYKDKAELLYFFGKQPRTRTLSNELIDSHFLIGTAFDDLTRTTQKESRFPYKLPYHRETLSNSVWNRLQRENRFSYMYNVTDGTSLYGKLTLYGEELHLYIPLEINGEIKINNLSLIARRYKRGFDPVKEAIDRTIKSVQADRRDFNVSDEYYINTLQEQIFSSMFRKQVLTIEGNRYMFLPFTLVEYYDKKVTDFAKLVLHHELYEPELVLANDIIEFTDKELNLKKGLFKYPFFNLTNVPEIFMNDYTNTNGNVKLLPFEGGVKHLSSYVNPAYKLNNPIRNTLGNHSTIQAMETTKLFDKRLVRPEVEHEVSTDIGYYFLTINADITDNYGHFAHEGTRLLDRSHAKHFKDGDKLATAGLDKGVSVIMKGIRIKAFINNEWIPVSIFNDADAVKRNNPGDVILAAFEAEIKYSSRNPKDWNKVLTGEIDASQIGLSVPIKVVYDDKREEHIGNHLLFYRYLYLTDRVRGSLSKYSDMILDTETKDYADGVRIGGEVISIFLEKGMEACVIDSLNEPIDDIILKHKLLKVNDTGLYGKHGKYTKLLTPKSPGVHATAAANRLVPKDETWIRASIEDAEKILKGLAVTNQNKINDILNGTRTHVATGYSYRPPRITDTSLRYTNLHLIIEDDTTGYAAPIMYFNKDVWAAMGGDHDGDEGFFVRMFSKEAIKELKEEL